ncbi:MAG: SDR family oxidoreductase [Thermomicrobiales bacterium]
MNRMRERFGGKVVLVTGAGRGIGEATAHRFAAEGADLVLLARTPETIAAVARQIEADHPGRTALPLAADVADPDAVEAAVRAAVARFGRIDVLVNNAAIAAPLDTLTADLAAWTHVVQVNLLGAVHLARAVSPHLPDHAGSAIVNVSSIHGYRVEPGSSPYDVAKGGLDQLTRVLALELAPREIRVNGVAPGFVDTPLAILPDGTSELDADWFRDVYVGRRKIPLARAADAAEIASAIAFLASADASYVNGTTLVVDGGLSITF